MSSFFVLLDIVPFTWGHLFLKLQFVYIILHCCWIDVNRNKVKRTILSICLSYHIRVFSTIVSTCLTMKLRLFTITGLMFALSYSVFHLFDFTSLPIGNSWIKGKRWFWNLKEFKNVRLIFWSCAEQFQNREIVECILWNLSDFNDPFKGSKR